MAEIYYRRIFLTVNAENGLQIDPETGEAIREAYRPYLKLNEYVLFCISLVDQYLTPMSYNVTDVFDLGADNNFIHTDDLCIYSDVYNQDVAGVLDWDEQDATAGKISIRAHTFDTALDTKLAGADSIQLYFEARRTSGGFTSVLYQDRGTVQNVVIENSPAYVPATPPVYRTAVAQDSLDILKANKVTSPVAGNLFVSDANGDLADAGYIGSALPITQAGHGLSVLNCVYSNAGTWTKAKADDADTLSIGLVLSVSGTDDFTLLASGFATFTAHGYTVGEYLLASSATAGALTEIPSTDLVDFSNPIAFVVDANTLFVFPWRPFQAVDRSNDVRVVSIDHTDSPYDVTDLDERIHADATAGAIQVNLPTPATKYDGFRVEVKNIGDGTNAVTVKSASGNVDGTIGTTGEVIAVTMDRRDFTCDGTDYWL